ncbi:hypothetical protein [Nonomuraea pusilla]|uniref:Uncharacterized protein n=1 Tax=Nonomuraea pusilla TaxID=46177 RepID=A0A1H8K3F6_9ACTN|nr:hypothetical protein [Nonomuraea pusilla]SEN87492.1 hypothetical protein SAMN05660976_08513 [Nonomuraea pusilla]
MRISKSAVILSAIALTVGLSGAATASAAAPAPKAYGACVNVKSGAMRLMEPLRLRRSPYGECKSNERKIYVPTRAAIPVVPPPPATVVYKRGAVVETCTKTADVTLTYDCKTAPVASPTPTPTS